MAQEENRFSIDDVLDQLSNKLINRHPHVFGNVTAEISADVLRNWEALKAKEKERRLAAGGGKKALAEEMPSSVLAGVSSAMPALLEAHKLSSRAAHVGFDWPKIGGLFQKLEEETNELKEELRLASSGTCGAGASPANSRTKSGLPKTSSGSGQHMPEELRHRLEEELGDMFFVLVNVARHLSLDPESAL